MGSGRPPRGPISQQRGARLVRTTVVAVVLIAGATALARPGSHSASALRPHPATTAVVPSTEPPSDPRHAVARPNLFAQPPIAQYLASRPDGVSAAVVDVRTGRAFVYHPRTRAITASIMKVDILETLLSRAQAEGETLTEEELELSRQMIEDSDNDAAQDLWDLIGGAPAVAAYNARVGLKNTVPNEAGYWGLSTTSALDQVRLVEQICQSSALLTRTSRDYALDLMTHVDPAQAWGVSAGVTPNAMVALKNGWLPFDDAWHVNSIGCVRGSGRDYVIAVLVGGAATEADGIRTIDGLSSLVWTQLAPSTGGRPGGRL